MEVLRSNLDALLPHIGDCVKKSVFIGESSQVSLNSLSWRPPPRS